MYTLISTSAIILHARNTGEADRVYIAYTQKLGLIRFKAIGIRKEKSKLRYHVQVGSLSQIEVVESRAGWRLTGAHNSSHKKDAFESIVRFGSILRKAVFFNEIDTLIWDICLRVYEQPRQLTQHIAMLLYVLGYLEEQILTADGKEQITYIDRVIREEL